MKKYQTHHHRATSTLAGFLAVLIFFQSVVACTTQAHAQNRYYPIGVGAFRKTRTYVKECAAALRESLRDKKFFTKKKPPPYQSDAYHHYYDIYQKLLRSGQVLDQIAKTGIENELRDHFEARLALISLANNESLFMNADLEKKLSQKNIFSELKKTTERLFFETGWDGVQKLKTEISFAETKSFAYEFFIHSSKPHGVLGFLGWYFTPVLQKSLYEEHVITEIGGKSILDSITSLTNIIIATPKNKVANILDKNPQILDFTIMGAINVLFNLLTIASSGNVSEKVSLLFDANAPIAIAGGALYILTNIPNYSFVSGTNLTAEDGKRYAEIIKKEGGWDKAYPTIKKDIVSRTKIPPGVVDVISLNVKKYIANWFTVVMVVITTSILTGTTTIYFVNERQLAACAESKTDEWESQYIAKNHYSPSTTQLKFQYEKNREACFIEEKIKQCVEMKFQDWIITQAKLDNHDVSEFEILMAKSKFRDECLQEGRKK